MPFPKKLLNSYETVRLDLHPHWWYLTPPVASLVGSIALTIVALVRASGDPSNADKALRIVALALLVICIIWLLARYLKWVTTNFVITSDRLIFRQGLLRKEGVQIPLERVNNVNFSQSLFERMIGAGDLVIESAGRDGQERFTDIKHPDRVTNLIHEAMEANEGRRAAGGAFAPPVAASPDVVTQIEKLEGLLQRGSITPEEFEAQKRKLLS
jgi:uncharacterized membrane protein YdbT with pleckstrin-like domain